ncbi:hypothetical protein [Nocardioides alcanivorans]|uniref:hypothetical protein n=1 Tax=Nocardioides alcanivorans TaxID=2897352 RepID=UPI001F3C1AD2|nr:hypothetical protein [Nocardioides alcanivorans]
MTDLTVVDLDADDLAWGEHAIAGADQPAGIVMLHADARRGTRSVMVRFPDGWRRDSTGNQPAGEEMVLLAGSLTMSGHACAVGQVLVVAPRATRSATVTGDGTLAVVWFSGPGGGWADGEADDAGEVRVLTADAALDRGPVPGLVGNLVGRDDVAGARFDGDVEVLWLEARRWAFVPVGSAVPTIPGFALVHTY